MNQKGIVWVPVIAMFLMVLLSGAAVIDGIITINKTVNPSPTPKSTNNPILNYIDASPIPTPILVNKRTTNNDQVIKHDGSRSGPIVDYFELCTGKTIKIYENERIPYRRITGEIVYSTKSDIQCYEDQIAQLRQQNTNNTSSYNTISGGANYNNSSYTSILINCPVDDFCNGNPKTYLLTSQQCSDSQKRAQGNCNQAQQIYGDQEKQRQANLANCLANAEQYKTDTSNMQNNINDPTGATNGIQNQNQILANQEYIGLVNQCHSLYGN